MSTAGAPPVRDLTQPRTLPRFKLGIPLDVTVLRSGIPDRIPGRSIDISDRGLGLVVAGELVAGESVGVEFLLPHADEPVQARAIVRHHYQLRSGIEFMELSREQEELVRSWTRRATQSRVTAAAASAGEAEARTPAGKADTTKSKPLSGRIRRLRFRIGLLALLALSLGWWRWQRGWTEIEAQLPAKAAVQPKLMVPSAVMEQRITHKVDPVYPEEAREMHLRGVVVLKAIIGEDGKVVSLQTLSGPEVLAQAAIEAARWWHYEPYLLNGEPVEVETTLAIQFSEGGSSMSMQ
ncbi:MAG TPA: TonB family protein [Terriglobales bacterium]|nr:TonB family protein [Terriglobales bacterium]